MSELWARALLSTYRWAGAASYPIVGSYLARRASGGSDEKARRRERYGRAGQSRPAGPLVWMHAAGDGETIALVGLIETVLQQGIRVVLTTSSVSSGKLVEERLGQRIIHQFVPLDFKPAVSRFLSHWQPDLAIIAESEIWPMTILELSARRIPHILVNGRMSDRAFAAWKKRAYLAEALFENFSLVVAQSEKDAERFRLLGARPVKVSGNLKTDIGPAPVNEDELDRLHGQIGRRECWTALATVKGEEVLLAEVHKLLKTRYQGILSVVVPREPYRADEIENEMTALGLNVSRRARGDKITSRTDILLGDTQGESGLYPRVAEVAFLGNSLVEGCGGCNPLETILAGSAVLSGQGIGYYRDIYTPLIARGGVKLVNDHTMLAGAVNFLLKNRVARVNMSNAAVGALDDMRGALGRTLRELEPYIQPLVVKSRLEDSRTARR